MVIPNPRLSSTSYLRLGSHRRYHHHHRHHLIITSLMPTAVNALLISIIALQFGTVCSTTITGDAGGEDALLAARNATSSSNTITNNDTYYYHQNNQEDDNIDNSTDNNNNVGINSSDEEKEDNYLQQLKEQQEEYQRYQGFGGGGGSGGAVSSSGTVGGGPVTRTRAPAECTQEPRFSILTSDSLLRSANVSYDENKKEIWTFGRIYLVLECRASSPIDFNFDGHLINKLQSVETTRITYEDPRMPSCYSIAITVETYRESTGNYTCWSLQEPILSTSLYMFAHGGTPPYLLHADIGYDVIEVDTDIHDRVVIIPCVVTNPNISVALYKINYEGFTLLPIGEYLSYDPKRGYLLQVRKYPDPYGKYKCIAMNSSHFDVIVHVKQPTDNFFHEPIVQGRLEIVQDRLGSQSFICNSSSHNPNIITSADCSTPINCRLARQCLRKSPYCSAPCRCSIRGDKCSKTLESNYAQIGFPIDKGCATIHANKNGGVVQCSAANFEPSAEIMYFIGLNGRIVQNWKSVPNDELVQVATLYEMPENVVFFVGEWIELRCVASRFMFSRGFQWKFQLINGTMISADAKAMGSQVSEEAFYIAEDVKVRVTRADISAVLCYSPVWNESGWIHNTLELSVKDSVAPSFIDPTNASLIFYINEQNNSIVCEAEGFPTPDIMWFKNGEEYIQNLVTDRTVANFTRAYVLLEELSLFDDQSVFVCNATNYRGTVMKAFTVNVREESLKLTLTVAGVGFIVLFGVFCIILWIFYTTSGNHKPGQYYAISEQEIENFFKGNPDAIKKCGDGVTKAIYHPYDQTFEISADDLLIDYDKPLGQGQFGVVLSGKLQTKQGAFNVAVKTTKDSDPNQLRSLLSEIKHLSYIGKHENIVNLIGAITKNLKKREVFVVVEYCQFGSLEEYLRQHRGTFFDEFHARGIANTCGTRKAAVSYVRLECLVKTSDLIIWAYQITNAMEYLSSRKIVHGDVALRNMLLDSNQNVKITDFGLSKHIYTQTSLYESKKKDTPLPWRWLAPETLKDQIFSLSGDVWSFGVLLYELFSLAEIPYTGLIYNDEFMSLLGNGFRLNQPPYANGEIYVTMRNCWRLDPNERPNFTTLKHFFLQFIRMQHPPNQTEIVQQMQLRHNRSSTEMDTDSSDLDKEDTATLTTFIPTANSFSTFGSVNSIVSTHQQHHQRPRGIVG